MVYVIRSKQLKRILSVMICTLLLSQNICKAYANDICDDVISFKTADKDILFASTDNAPYDMDKISSSLKLENLYPSESVNVSETEIDIDTSDISNWYVYDHYDTKAYADKAEWKNKTGYDEGFRPYYPFEEETSRVVSAKAYSVQEALKAAEDSENGNVYYMKEHIAVSSGDGKSSMQFYGYGTDSCTDFLFYPAEVGGAKKVSYRIDSKNVRTHSLVQAGFLFNCGIENDKLYGYAMMFQFLAGDAKNGELEQNIKAKAFKAVNLYRLDGVDVSHKSDNVHDKGIPFAFATESGNLGVTLLQSNKDISNADFNGHFDISDIRMTITDSSLKAVMVEGGSNRNNPPSQYTLFDIKNGVISPASYGGFGPIVAYDMHYCTYTSSYIYSDLKMGISGSESLLSGVGNNEFIQEKVKNGNYTRNSKYVILLGDNSKGVSGYRDYFQRELDDVYLEMLKKEKAVLITNLNITNSNDGFTGTDYDLEKYLGKGNVIQISGEDEEELAEQIRKQLLNASYSESSLSETSDALQDTGSKHSIAKCILTYNGRQVDKVNISRLKEKIVLKIDDSLSINAVNAVYTLTRPDGTSEILSGDSISIINDMTVWMPGRYTIAMDCNNGAESKIYFEIDRYYNSYFNNTLICEGNDYDSLSLCSDTVGVNKVIPGNDYCTKLLPDNEHKLPEQIVVKTDSQTEGITISESGSIVNASGETITPEILKEGVDYTYDSETGKLAVKAESITGNVYLYADTSNITYQLTNMSAGDCPVTRCSLYDNKDLTIELETTPDAIVFPEKVFIVINGREFVLPDGQQIDIENGKMLYTSGKKENTSSGEIYSKGSVVISEELLKYDITLRAAAENKAPDVKPDIPVSSGDGEAADKDEIENPPEETKPSQEQNLLEETKPLQDVNTPASELPAVKEEQQKPDVSIMEIIHPTYKNSNNGKIIGVSSNMEYSVDGGNTWITCTSDTISGLGEGSVKLRFFATPAKNSSPIAIIELKSVNKEYYIPTICMTKKMGLKQKFQLKFANVKGAAIECSSSNSSIVTVNKKGLIKSKKKQGKAKVVVSIIKGNHIVQYIAIIKVRKSVKKNYSLVKFKTTEKSPAIALYKNIPVGKKWKMRFDYTKNAKLTFYSSNKDAAYVDKKGNVTGIGAGKAIIYIKVENEQVTDWYYVVVRTTDSGMKTDTSYLKVIK